MAQCQALLTDRSRRCRGSAIRGKTVCKKHGGMGGGVIKHGRDSKAAKPFELLRQTATPEMLNLGRHVAILDRYLADLAERLPENESPNLRTRVLAYLTDDEGPRVDEAVELLEKGVAWDTTWRKLIEVSEREAAIIHRHLEVQARAEVALPAARVMLLFQQFIKIVRDVTGDPTMTKKILGKTYREVLGAEPRMALLAPEGESAAATVVEARQLPSQTGTEEGD